MTRPDVVRQGSVSDRGVPVPPNRLGDLPPSRRDGWTPLRYPRIRPSNRVTRGVGKQVKEGVGIGKNLSVATRPENLALLPSG